MKKNVSIAHLGIEAIRIADIINTNTIIKIIQDEAQSVF